MTAALDAFGPSTTYERRPLLRLVPIVLTHPKVFVATVAAIVFHQVCSIGAVVAGAVVVGRVASGENFDGIQGWFVALAGLAVGPASATGPRCGWPTTSPTNC